MHEKRVPKGCYVIREGNLKSVVDLNERSLSKTERISNNLNYSKTKGNLVHTCMLLLRETMKSSRMERS